MIQDTNGNTKAAFFPKVFSSKDSKASLAGKINKIDGDDSYESVMKSTLASKKSAPAKVQKLDKPKIGNREPFFPVSPMPYHPEVKSKDVEVQGDKRIEAKLQLQDLNNNQEEESNDLMERIVKQKDLKDDYKGILKDAYESSTVSYPVKQIASQSLDEDVKTLLQEQGLWDTQGFYMAKPSEQMMTSIPVQKPVAQFMASMENELGISPDSLVKAYGELEPGQLLKSPQETMGEVLKKLDLNAGDQKKATELYSKMLTQMQSLDEKQPVKLDVAALALGTELQKDSFQPVQQQLKLEENFPQASAQQTAIGAYGTKMQSSSQQNMGEFSQESSKEGLKKQAEVKIDKVSVQTPQAPALASKHFEAPLVNNQLGQNMAVADAMGLNAGKEAKQETIQSIVNNAHALSQKGGGEMKLTLTPEHLGEIQLKVTMNGNQVGVQMIAERAEAKKLLEQNIQELKHGLATHNLTMDRLDVSIGDKNTGTNHQNGKPDFNQPREFAQQFNQNLAGRRQSDDKPTLAQGRKIPGSMLRPASENPAMKIPRTQGSSKLNVVA